MQENNPPKNTFKLEGVVQQIKPLESGNKNGKEWCKLEILIAQQSGNYINKFPIICWNDKAKSVSQKLCVNDIVSVDAIVGSREYQNIEDGSYKYYLQLTFYNYEILVSNHFDPNTTNNTDYIVSEFTNQRTSMTMFHFNCRRNYAHNRNKPRITATGTRRASYGMGEQKNKKR